MESTFTAKSIFQHEGDLNHPFVDRFQLSLAELFDKGQADGHMHIRAASMQVRQHHQEEIPAGWIDEFQVFVMLGQIGQVVQIAGSQAGLFREAQFDIIGIQAAWSVTRVN